MTYTVGAEGKGVRLDAFLAEDPALSRSAAARLIASSYCFSEL